MNGAALLRSPLVTVGGTLVGLLVAVALLAPVLAPYDPHVLAGDALERPSARHLLGTNHLGQDLLSQLVWGSRPSASVALGGATLAVLLAIGVGVGAGLVGGWVDVAAMRAVDVFLALPTLPLLVLVAALTGVSWSSLVIAIGALSWPPMARLVRSQALSLRRRGFVEAAQGFGGGVRYIVARHLAPALGPLLVAAFVAIAARAVLLEAGLAFLGLADPTTVSWGLMLHEALSYPALYFSALWSWWVLPAGFAITVAVLGFTFLGVGLEPVFNPRWGRTR